MKIVHVSLAGFYTENMTYQENLLTQYNARDGHETTILSANFQWEGAQIVRVPVCDRVMEDGVRLIRLKYVNPDSHFTHQKIRRVKGLYPLLEQLAPDVILSHGLCYGSVLDVIRYKKNHPEIKLYADTHTDYYTSGTNWLSRRILHGVFYRWLVQKALPYVDKYFYLSESCRKFGAEIYGVPDQAVEFWPLGGAPLPDKAYQTARAKRRAELGLAEDTPLLLHAGKLEPMKRTAALLRAFAAAPEVNARLAVVGSLTKETEEEVRRLIEADKRVIYLGWKSGEELQEYLCACDLYCQPGKVSAVMQNAVCCRCPILLYPHLDYQKDFDWGNICWAETEADMTAVFRALDRGELPLDRMRENSARCARELLDNQKLAARLYR